MDPFVAITVGCLILAVGAVLLLGIGAPRRFVTDVMARRENERWASQLQIESHELLGMLEAANAYRRARGMPEVTIEHFQQKAIHQQRALIRQAERYLESRKERSG